MKPEHKRAHETQEIQMEKVYPHPPEHVWEALTDPKALAEWLLPTNFKPKPGHRFHFSRLSKRGKRQQVRCQVVELDAPHRLAYTWQADDEEVPSLVTWTLEAVADGTRLRLEHIGLETSCPSSGGNVHCAHRGNSLLNWGFAERLARYLVVPMHIKVGPISLCRYDIGTIAHPTRSSRTGEHRIRKRMHVVKPSVSRF